MTKSRGLRATYHPKRACVTIALRLELKDHEDLFKLATINNLTISAQVRSCVEKQLRAERQLNGELNG